MRGFRVETFWFFETAFRCSFSRLTQIQEDELNLHIWSRFRGVEDAKNSNAQQKYNINLIHSSKFAEEL